MNPLVTSLIASSRHRLAPYPRFTIPLASNTIPSNDSITATFTRNSSATYIDANGVLQTAGIDVPRFQNGRYLCEPSGTNLLIQSGTPATQVITVSSGTSYTVQCYGSGSITLSGAGSGTVVEGTSKTFTASSTSLIWAISGSLSRAQVETGTQATSYIPTTTAPVTRAADVLHYTVGDVITQGQGSLYCEFIGWVSSSSIRVVLALSDGSNSNRVYAYISTTGLINAEVTIAGSYSSGVYTSSYISSSNNKFLITYNTSQFTMYLNGVLVATRSNIALPTTPNTVSAGCTPVGQYQLNNEIGNIKYFKEALTEAEAIKLTTL